MSNNHTAITDPRKSDNSLQGEENAVDKFTESYTNNEDSEFFKTQASSLKFIIITFICTGFLQLFFDFLREEGIHDKCFQCDQNTESKMFYPINTGGDFYMFFY